MVSLGRPTAAGSQHARLPRLNGALLAAAYYGVHVGGVYLRFYQLSGRHAAAGPIFARQNTDDVIQPPSRRQGRLPPRQRPQVPDPAHQPQGSPSTPSTARVSISRCFKHTFLLRPRAESPALSSADVAVARFFLVLAAMLVARQAARRARRADRAAGGAGRARRRRPARGACSASSRTAGRAGGAVIHVLAELGVVLLLFEIGLETDLREMFRVGPAVARRRGRGGGSAVRPRLSSTGRTCRTPLASATGRSPRPSSSEPRSPPRPSASRPGSCPTWDGWRRRRRGSSSAPPSSTMCSGSSS